MSRAAGSICPQRGPSVAAILNSAFRRGLSVGVNDGSSAIRLYRTSVVNSLQLESTDYDILQEVLVRAHSAGGACWRSRWTTRRTPRLRSKAHAALASAYLRTFWALWKLRNSIAAADYDYRAHDSPIPLQRYWQRSRFRHISELIDGEGPVLDVGCGSSHIIGVLPKGSVALDVLINKLRFARRFPSPRVRGVRLCAAVCRRQLSLRALLPGHRARADGPVDD